MAIKKTDINLIDANHHRDFNIHRIENTRVEELESSIESNGFDGVFVVRPHPDEKGRFELVYGHHRLQACKNLGFDTVPCQIEKKTDREMLVGMTIENAMQRESQFAAVDSVSSIQVRVGCLVLASPTYEAFEKNVEEEFGEPHTIYTKSSTFVKARNDLIKKGKLPGRSAILAYLPPKTFNSPKLQSALLYINKTGLAEPLVERVFHEVDVDAVSKAHEDAAAEVEKEYAEVAETLDEVEALQEEYDDMEVKLTELKIEGRKDPEKKKEAMAFGKELTAKKAEIKEKTASVSKEDVKDYKTALAQTANPVEKQDEIIKESLKVPATINHIAAGLLAVDSHRNAFMRIMGTDRAKAAFPYEDQVATVESMLAEIADDAETYPNGLNAESIQDWMKSRILEHFDDGKVFSSTEENKRAAADAKRVVSLLGSVQTTANSLSLAFSPSRALNALLELDIDAIDEALATATKTVEDEVTKLRAMQEEAQAEADEKAAAEAEEEEEEDAEAEAA